MRDGVEGVAGVALDKMTPWHSHRHAVFGVVDSGRQTIALRAGVVAIDPGMGFALPRGLAHRCLHGRETAYRVLCIDSERPFAFCVFSSPSWAESFDCTFAELRGAKAIKADRLIDQAAAALESPVEPIRPPPYVESSLVDLDADLEDEMTLAKLAKRHGLSLFHLQRMFTRYVGLTPSQARVCARVRASRLSLADGMRPTEVAYLCGFADQSHLTRTFEKFMGVAPKRYQRQVTRSFGE